MEDNDILQESEEENSDLGRLTAANNALRAALEDNTVPRPWKKKAVNFMVVIFELQEDIRKGKDVSPKDLEKTLRQIDDLLNQLNRY